MDPETLRAVAKLARSRAAMQDRFDLMAHKDGLERVGAKRALQQLAADLEASADHVGRGDDEGDDEA